MGALKATPSIFYQIHLLWRWLFNKFSLTAGYSAGITSDVNFGLGLGINTGLLFIQRNIEHENGSLKVTDHCSSLELPLNLKYQIKLPTISPFAIGGPYLDFGLGRKQWGHKTDYEKWSHRMSGGFTLGVGADIFKSVRVMYQYD